MPSVQPVGPTGPTPISDSEKKRTDEVNAKVEQANQQAQVAKRNARVAKPKRAALRRGV